jgi:DNA-binding NarL/FixJ family response regulator
MRARRSGDGPRRPASAAPHGDTPIRIVLAIQARLDREALAALLRTQPGFIVVGGAGTSEDVSQLCTRERPDVLLLSALIPWPHGASVYPLLGLCSPRTQVLVIAPHTADRCTELNPLPREERGWLAADLLCATSALARGARGALQRDVEPEELFQAIRAVARGERWVGSGVSPPTPPASPLSTRERVVSLRVGRGDSNKEIATALRISEGTVKKHIGHALHKLGLHDRLQLGLCVARHRESFEDE